MDFGRLIRGALALVAISVGSANAQTNRYRDFHDFGGSFAGSNGVKRTDGWSCVAPVTFDAAGNMYGTTTYGGAHNAGVVWELGPGGYTVLHDFGGPITNRDGQPGDDGSGPTGGVAFDGFGNMYGCTRHGGERLDGMAWAILSNGTYIDLHDFGDPNANGQSGTDGILPDCTVCVDAHGTVYGTTTQGGTYHGGTVWAINSTGVYFNLHSFGGTVTNASGVSGPDGAICYCDVTVDSAGNLYGTAYQGGANNSGIVWRQTPSGAYQDLHDFGGTITNASGAKGPDGEYPECPVTFDSAGNLYGTTFQGGPFNPFGGAGGNVWEIKNGGGYVDLHDFGGNTLDTNGMTGPDGNHPGSGVTLDSHGNLFGVTTNGGQFSNKYGGFGMAWEIGASIGYVDLHDFGSTQGNGVPDGFYPSAGLVIDAAGNIYGTTYGGGANDSANGSQDGLVWELAPGLLSINIAPTTVTGGAGVTGTVTLAGNAAAGGAVVALSSNSGFASVPPSVTVPEGQTTATFVVKTLGVSATSLATLSASFPGVTRTAVLTLQPVALSSLSLQPTNLVGGAACSGTISLSAAAPASGVTVSLSSSSSAATVPASVTIAAGATSASFPVTTVPVVSDSNANISATYGSTSTTAILTVRAPVNSGVSLSPSSIPGGASAVGTVTLTGAAAAGGVKVSLSTTSTLATVPKDVIVPAGATSTTFAVHTTPVSKAVSLKVNVNGAGGTQSATLVIESPTISTFTLSPASLVGGSNGTGKLTLDGAAPKGGITISLASGSAAAKLPSHVTIAAGATSATFVVSTTPVPASVSATLTATGASTSKTAILVIQPPKLSTLSLNPSTVKGGGRSTGTLTLSGPAPAGGIKVSLSSNLKGVTVPVNEVFNAGSTSINFTIRTVATKATVTATIKVTGAGSTSAILTITP